MEGRGWLKGKLGNVISAYLDGESMPCWRREQGK